MQKQISLPPLLFEISNHMATAPFIFLAEDDIDDQELLAEAFAQIDNTISIRAVNNGKKAIALLEELSPEDIPCLIILDYNLPELSGAEILERLNSISRYDDIIKVVWSTSNSPVYEKICLDLGAKAYLVKPNDISGIHTLAQLMLQMCTVK
jgi:CheY-like chemotaxis protein